MAISGWSTTAADNASVGSVNFAEGQAPSTVNNSSRALMADVRTYYEGVEWRDLGHTPTQLSATTFSVTGDKTAYYTANRPIRCTDSSTYYGVIVSSSYASVTTVTVSLISGSLSGSLSAVAVGVSAATKSINYNGVSFQETSAGATGVSIDYYHDSASPANSDTPLVMTVSGRDSAANKQTYGTMTWTVTDTTSGSEDSTFAIQTVVGGTVADRVTVGQGIQVGAPAGGDKGPGTANAAVAFYVGGSGLPVQRVEATPVTALTACTTAIPADDTIPQNTEGDEVVTVSITPKATTNRLVIDFYCFGAIGSAVYSACALFQDSTANALTASVNFHNVGSVNQFIIRHEMAAGTTSSTTFKIRIGPSSGTYYVNGATGGTRLLGGVGAARLSVTEWAA